MVQKQVFRCVRGQVSRVPLIEVQSLTKQYGSKTVLQNVSFCIDGPAIVGVLGPNGAGKTTLLEILEGLSDPSAGTYSLFGSPCSCEQYPRSQVGVLLQREYALDEVTVEEYSELFAAIQKVPKGAEKIITQARLENRKHVRVDKISGGEAQRLFFAASSVHNPKILFLDEPSAPLDPSAKLTMRSMIKEQSQRSTIVMTTHDLRDAEQLCDRVLFLVDGQIRADGSISTLLSQVKSKEQPTLEDAYFHFCGSKLSESGETI